MALSTTQYGYIIDPMVPFTDGKGNTIKDGFVRVFVAGSSTPVITYRNFDGAANQDLIELDNSGRTKTSVIGSKGLTYKVCVYDKHHSQESPILTVDKVSVIGANITAGAGATVVTGIDGLKTKPDGFVDASVIGTDGYVALDHTLVTDDLDTDAKVTAVEEDRYVPLLNDDVNDPDSKITLGRFWKWVLGKNKSLSTITAFRTGDVIPVDGPSGTSKMPKDNLLKITDSATFNDELISNDFSYGKWINSAVGTLWNSSLVDEAGKSVYINKLIDVSHKKKIYVIVNEYGTTSGRYMGFANASGIVTHRYAEKDLPWEDYIYNGTSCKRAVLDVEDVNFFFSAGTDWGNHVWQGVFYESVSSRLDDALNSLDRINTSVKSADEAVDIDVYKSIQDVSIAYTDGYYIASNVGQMWNYSLLANANSRYSTNIIDVSSYIGKKLKITTGGWQVPSTRRFGFVDADGILTKVFEEKNAGWTYNSNTGLYEAFIDITDVGFVWSMSKDYTNQSFYIAENKDFVNKILSQYDEKYGSENKASLFTPKVVPAVKNMRGYICYESLIQNGLLEDNVCYIGIDYYKQAPAFKYKYTSAGTQNVKAIIKDKNNRVLDEKTIQIKVVDSSQAFNYKILVCGDSKTENQKKLFQLANLVAQDPNASITFLGTKSSTGTDFDGNTRTTRAEGYSSRNVINLCRDATLNGSTNIFYDGDIAGDNKFSFAKGVAALGDCPDILFIDHGANQNNPVSPLSANDVYECYESIISSVADYNTANGTDVKVVICVQEWGALGETLDGYADSKWAVDYAKVKPKDYLTHFENREDEGVFICPQYVCVDPDYDYPTVIAPYPLNKNETHRVVADKTHPGINMPNYNGSTTYNRGNTCQNDNRCCVCLKDGVVGITPSNDLTNWAVTEQDPSAGYYKVAGMYYSVLKYIASVS